MDTVIANLLVQNNYSFQMQTDALPNTQVEFIKVLSDGVTSFTSIETMKKHNLVSVSNIRSIREALV